MKGSGSASTLYIEEMKYTQYPQASCCHALFNIY